MIQTHDSGGVRLLTLDRPDKLNAMTSALYQACADSLAEAADNDAIAAVVLTGAGRAFCAGNDLGELMSAASGESTTSGADQGHAFATFMHAIATFPKAFLAAVNGVGVGIGMTLLPYCDAALIAESARLRGPFVPLGVAPEAGSSATFAAVMGWQRAAYILLSGRWVSAPEAVELGLALEVAPDAEVVERTVALAREIATAGPLGSIVATKALIIAGRSDLVTAAREREDATFASLFGAGVPGTTSAF
ncbi:MAG: enoyl-CoA hydratase/isomerase family protein [Acidimicrobiia bacterium]|nr:enoyl-CoA hydratase/isomerase family protein [Acidimicrobiia bacterium]